MKFRIKIAAFLGAMVLSPLSASADFSFEGYLAYANGTPVTGAVTVSLKVLSPGAEACILYSEDHNAALPSDGYTALSVGSGTRTDGQGHTLGKAFENSGTFTGLTCSVGTTYTPTAGDKRKLKVVVTVGGTTEILGLIDINPVPTALSASNVAGFTPSNLMRVETGGVPGPVSAFTPAQVLELGNLISGTSSNYMKNNPSQGATLPTSSVTPASATAGSLWYDTTTNQIKYHNGTIAQALGGGGGGTVTNVTSSNSDIFIANPTTSPMLTLNTGLSANQIVKLDGSARLPGVDASQVMNINASNITTGILPVVRGGTGVVSLPSYSMIMSNGSGNMQGLVCTNGQYMKFGVTGPECNNLESYFFQMGGNSVAAPAVIGTNNTFPLKLKTNSVDRIIVTPNGEVGVGVSTPMARLQVQGQIVSNEFIVPSGATADFMNGNSIVLQSVGGTTINLMNMAPGGRYTVVVEDATSRTYTFSGCSTAKFSPANAATSASTRTIYDIYYSGSVGGTCYIHMTSGYL